MKVNRKFGLIANAMPRAVLFESPQQSPATGRFCTALLQMVRFSCPGQEDPQPRECPKTAWRWAVPGDFPGGEWDGMPDRAGMRAGCTAVMYSVACNWQSMGGFVL